MPRRSWSKPCETVTNFFLRLYYGAGSRRRLKLQAPGANSRICEKHCDIAVTRHSIQMVRLMTQFSHARQAYSPETCRSASPCPSWLREQEPFQWSSQIHNLLLATNLNISAIEFETATTARCLHPAGQLQKPVSTFTEVLQPVPHGHL